jgi:hypothetical protein
MRGIMSIYGERYVYDGGSTVIGRTVRLSEYGS